MARERRPRSWAHQQTRIGNGVAVGDISTDHKAVFLHDPHRDMDDEAYQKLLAGKDAAQAQEYYGSCKDPEGRGFFETFRPISEAEKRAADLAQSGRYAEALEVYRQRRRSPPTARPSSWRPRTPRHSSGTATPSSASTTTRPCGSSTRRSPVSLTMPATRSAAPRRSHNLERYSEALAAYALARRLCPSCLSADDQATEAKTKRLAEARGGDSRIIGPRTQPKTSISVTGGRDS